MTQFPFPKIDLHCHLDGAIEPKTLYELGSERGLALPADTAEGLVPFVVYDPSLKSVNEYLKRFDLPTMILQDAAALERVAFELADRMADRNHGYGEIRFAPQQHVQKGLTQEAAIIAVSEGLRRAEAAHEGFKTGLICCAMSYGPPALNRDANLETVRATIAQHAAGRAAGFDLAGAEGIVGYADFAELFDAIHVAGVPATCHAGDSDGPDTVRIAIERFGVRRIGHGHHIYNDPELCKRAIALGVTLEICLTSNIQCLTQPSYEQHPAKKLFDMGMRITLNTDNPVIAGVSLHSEYQVALARCGFTYRDLVQMNIYSAECSFQPAEAKAALIARLERYAI